MLLSLGTELVALLVPSKSLVSTISNEVHMH